MNLSPAAAGPSRAGHGPVRSGHVSLATGPLQPLPIRSAGDRIADRFVTAIALGQFVPGQRLPSERNLAATLQVSRATVREALARLVATGYLTVRRGRGGGYLVATDWGPESAEHVRRALLPEWAQFEQLLDFRGLVEQQIARTAALRRTRTDIAHITAALQAYAEAGDDRESSRAADLAVHQSIAVATHNDPLLELSLQLRRDISLGFAAEPYDQQLRARALHQHPLLAQAVVDGAADAAAAQAAEHFSLTASKLRTLHDRVERRPPHQTASRPQT